MRVRLETHWFSTEGRVKGFSDNYPGPFSRVRRPDRAIREVPSCRLGPTNIYGVEDLGELTR